LIGVEPEIIQSAEANRVRVLVLRKCLAAPSNCSAGLSNTPGLAAVALVVKRAIVRPTGLLRWRMKFDVTDVRPRPEGHTKGLDRAIQVHVIKRILIVPNTGTRVSHFVTHKPNPIVVWIWFKLVHCSARRHPGLDGGLHPYRVTDGCKVEISGAGDMELTVRGIVKHVALIRMRLAPGVFTRGDILRFSKIGCALIERCVQIIGLNTNTMRHAVVYVAGVVVWRGLRIAPREKPGKGIDPCARPQAVLTRV